MKKNDVVKEILIAFSAEEKLDQIEKLLGADNSGVVSKGKIKEILDGLSTNSDADNSYI